MRLYALNGFSINPDSRPDQSSNELNMLLMCNSVELSLNNKLTKICMRKQFSVSSLSLCFCSLCFFSRSLFWSTEKMMKTCFALSKVYARAPYGFNSIFGICTSWKSHFPNTFLMEYFACYSNSVIWMCRAQQPLRGNAHAMNVSFSFVVMELKSNTIFDASCNMCVT